MQFDLARGLRFALRSQRAGVQGSTTCDHRPFLFCALTKTNAKRNLVANKRMKTLGFFGCVFLFSLGLASGQSPPEPPPGPPMLTATNRLQRIFGPTAVYDGVFPEVSRRGGVLEPSDWRAPVVPGKEFRNVSINPHTGQAQGVVLFTVRF
jgi:hypothetical protein